MQPRKLPILALMLGLAGCGAGERDRSEERRATTIQSGHAVFGHEVRSFRPCGSSETLWAIDSSAQLWDLHRELAPHLELYEEVFAVVEAQHVSSPREGFGADYGGGLLIGNVLYAAREGFNCEFSWNGFRFRALGNEPFWSVVVSDSTILLRRLGEDGNTWMLAQEDQRNDTILLTGRATGADPISVEITRRDCRDTMSGAFFGLSASVRIGTSVLTGCALQGHEDPASG